MLQIFMYDYINNLRLVLVSYLLHICVMKGLRSSAVVQTQGQVDSRYKSYCKNYMKKHNRKVDDVGAVCPLLHVGAHRCP